MEQYLIYLRKSRKDRDMEQETGIFDTLQRHRDTLLALADSRQYPVSGIFEEVVSGDTIAERPEMQKLLSAVETGTYSGVLVMEVPRLARGNTRDQGTVAETFKYSSTKIITPDKVYDPSDESDEEYFEFGLFMSRREYMAINRRLQRGRKSSLNEGKYIAGTPPYGYHKKKIEHQKGYTLEINQETAPVVREIFEFYTIGCPKPDGRLEPIGSHAIANRLNTQGIPSPGGIQWSASSVRDILKNPTYAGYLRWAYRPQTKQMMDGILRTSYPINKDYQLQKGLHEAIISEHTWALAKAMICSRRHAPVPNSKQLTNPLAGLLYCSICGRSLVQLPGGSRGSPMVMCPTANCPTVGSRRDLVEQLVLKSLSEWLKDDWFQIEQLPSNDSRFERELLSVHKNLEKLNTQKTKLYELLEQGIYGKDVFIERFLILEEKIKEAESTEHNLQSHLKTVKDAGYQSNPKVSPNQNIRNLYYALPNPADQNALLKSVLDHVIYKKSTGGQWKRSDLELYIYPKVLPFQNELQQHG